MGQAFDDQGGVLGEAFGETKRDVFDKLIADHPNAHEIRIKAMQDAAREQTLNAFKAGDVVMLKSDPTVRMTVRAMDHQTVLTLWFADSILKDGRFPADALTHAPDRSGTRG